MLYKYNRIKFKNGNVSFLVKVFFSLMDEIFKGVQESLFAVFARSL